MHEEILNFLDNLEKPLFFSSRKNYSNIEKIKNLDSVVEELCLKILSRNPPGHIKERISSIRNSFRSYTGMTPQQRKNLIGSTIEEISDIRSLLSDEKQEKDTDSFPVKGKTGDLRGDIQYIKGIGPSLKKKFEKKQVFDIGDLLFYFPRKYEDRREIKKISRIVSGKRQTVMGKVMMSGTVRTRSRTIYNVIISDGTANLVIVWFRFNQKYLKNVFRKGTTVCVNGEVVYNNYERTLQIIHPNPEDIEILDNTDLEERGSLNFNRIVPVYPLTEGLKQKRLRSILDHIVQNYAGCLSEVIPEQIADKYNLMPLNHAVSEVHYPSESTGCVDLESGVSVYRSRPHKTVSFFEFLILELAVGLIRVDVKQKTGIPVISKGVLENSLLGRLPFSLTNAQKKVLAEIKGDMRREYPMNRLLQGDVGSGKTIIAVLSMLNVVESGYQAVLMAPTEILAEQHFRSVYGYLEDMDLNITMLRGGIGKKEKDRAYEDIRTGRSHIIVGTHALIEEKVEFKSLGLVIVDEQHRFGVVQRTKLVEKAADPHVLVMTATPIPRTLAITVYGDLDLSVIDELPAGREKITTQYFKNNREDRRKVYSIVKDEVDKGRQAYFVCPMIEASEDSDNRGISYATEMAAELREKVFTDYRVGLLHGRMSPEEKDIAMRSFIRHETDILVSTTVIEVGVDVPNATLMVIENAERFGLSQLHQLRGRIGRGEHRSRCILISSFNATEEAEKKIRIMCETTDGFVIAEEDLKIRGPGDFLGTKQSGIPTFSFADLLRDHRILSEAREAAFSILKEDPALESYPALKKYIEFRNKKTGTTYPVT